MLKDIVEVQPYTNYRLGLKFEDGVCGTVDISRLIDFEGIFEPLSDPDYFRRVKVNTELGIVHWPNGADLDPDVLYSEVTGQPIQIAVPIDYR